MKRPSCTSTSAGLFSTQRRALLRLGDSRGGRSCVAIAIALRAVRARARIAPTRTRLDRRGVDLRRRRARDGAAARLVDRALRHGRTSATRSIDWVEETMEMIGASARAASRSIAHRQEGRDASKPVHRRPHVRLGVLPRVADARARARRPGVGRRAARAIRGYRSARSTTRSSASSAARSSTRTSSRCCFAATAIRAIRKLYPIRFFVVPIVLWLAIVRVAMDRGREHGRRDVLGRLALGRADVRLRAHLRAQPRHAARAGAPARLLAAAGAVRRADPRRRRR